MLNQKSEVAFSQSGYLINFDDWTEAVAHDIAHEHGLELTDCHWTVINFMRDYFQEYGISPEPREVIRNIGDKVTPPVECSRKKLEGLFTIGDYGGCKLACKIAGLPHSYCKGC